MAQLPHRRHVAEATRWSRDAPVDPVEIVTAGIGMATPVLIGAVTGHLGSGLIVALGSLLIGGSPARTTFRQQARVLFVTFLSPFAATLATAAIAGHGRLTDVMMVLLVGLASLLGGVGRVIAGATMRFGLFVIIILAVAPPGVDHATLAVLTIAGSIWAVVVDLAIGAAARRIRRRSGRGSAAIAEGSGVTATVQEPPLTRAERSERWRKSLITFEGWQYTLRLAACLAIAVVLGWMWPNQHFHWIALTIALLADRQVEVFPVKATQRTIGTAIGVAATSLLMVFQPPGWFIVPAIGLLAAARPLVRVRNYLAYSIVMTPLIIILMDAGTSPGIDVLVDRLVATLVGAGLIITANAVVARRLAPSDRS